MLRQADREILDRILEVEGGFVDDPDDKGGPTNFGITAETLGEWRHLGRPATRAEVENLDVLTARTILGRRFIEGPGFDTIAGDQMRALVVDMWVNHGPRRATLIIQKALKLPGDGIMGPATLESIRHAQEPGFNAILAERIRFYGRLITNDLSQSKFAAGWLDRAADFLCAN